MPWDQQLVYKGGSVNSEIGSLGKRLSPSSSFGLLALGERPTFQWLSSVLGVSLCNTGWDCPILMFCHLAGECVGGALKSECLKENLHHV